VAADQGVAVTRAIVAAVLEVDPAGCRTLAVAAVGNRNNRARQARDRQPDMAAGIAVRPQVPPAGKPMQDPARTEITRRKTRARDRRLREVIHHSSTVAPTIRADMATFTTGLPTRPTGTTGIGTVIGDDRGDTTQ
jgi:hypothetical protein